jgi:hypothetical protein
MISPAKIFVCLLVSFASLSNAVSSGRDADSAQNELLTLLKARSLAELEATTTESAAVRSEHEACSSELQLRLLPRNCFKRLNHGAENTDEAQRLSRICVENAKKSTSRLDLENSTATLPRDCQQAARDRFEDLRYIDDHQRPEHLAGRTSGPDFEINSSH